jgi:ribosomal protein S18 acetylase RimI-like enzyme
MNIEFRLANIEDFQRVLEIFNKATNDMNIKGIYQWDNIYPNTDILSLDIQKEQMHLAVSENEILSAFVINSECDDEYKKAQWNYPNLPYIVVHRLCVNPEYQNMGIGMKSMLEIESIARKNGIKAIRLDAFTENPSALRLYEKLGYSITGYADWRKGRFALMEKKL